jgi:DNA-binding transcriptional ArsR family regulator
MKINKTDVSLLNALAQGPQKTSDLALKINLSKGRTSAILKKLTGSGLVEKWGWSYAIAQSGMGGRIKEVVMRNPAIRLGNILPDTEYGVLLSLTPGSKTPREIAEEIRKTARTVYLKLETFRSMGIVDETGAGTYALNKDARAYRDVKTLLEGGRIASPFPLSERAGWTAWSGYGEYILKTRNPKELKNILREKGLEWKYTSGSALSRYGIHLIPPETTLYVRSGTDKPRSEYARVEDTIIHMLLDGTENAQEYSKWLLILHKNRIDRAYLRKNAKKHGLTKQIDGVLYDLKPVLG